MMSLFVFAMAACSGPRGVSGSEGPVGPQGPQGEAAEEVHTEVVWVSDGSSCAGEHKLPTLLQDFYFTTEGGHTKMRRESDDGVEQSWPTAANDAFHESTFSVRNSNSAFGLEVQKITLTIMRASGCGFVHAREEVVEGL